MLCRCKGIGWQVRGSRGGGGCRFRVGDVVAHGGLSLVRIGKRYCYEIKTFLTLTLNFTSSS